MNVRKSVSTLSYSKKRSYYVTPMVTATNRTKIRIWTGAVTSGTALSLGYFNANYTAHVDRIEVWRY